MRSSLGASACKWMERNLVHGTGDLYGQPYRLMPWHRELTWRWSERGPTEKDPSREDWWYTEALFGAESGASKTEFVAALACLDFAGPEPFRRTSPVISSAAASLEQAGELFQQIQIMLGGTDDQPCESAPLRGYFRIFDREIYYADGRPGKIRRVAANASTAEGGKESLFLGDEIHEWHGAVARVWDVRSKSLSKRTPPGRSIGISTAGLGRGSMPPSDADALLWRMYARGLMTAGDPTSRFLFDWVEAPVDVEQARGDEALLRVFLRSMRAADISWSVETRLREILTHKIPWTEALRYYFNRFVLMGSHSWLHEIPGVWEECASADAVPADGTEIVVGVDMALHQDSVGVVGVGMLGDGRVGLTPRCWTPVNGRIDHMDVFQWIAGPMADRWRIKSVVYDPRFFEIPATMLEDRGFTVIEFRQSPERLYAADTVLFSSLTNHLLAHPNDPTLNAHAANAAWRYGESGRYLAKSKASGKMDLIRAASMAVHELLVETDDAQGYFDVP